MVALVFLAMLAVAEGCLAIAEHKGYVSSEDWDIENTNINRMNYAKLHNSPTDPVWHSNGIPYPRPKTAKKRVLIAFRTRP